MPQDTLSLRGEENRRKTSGGASTSAYRHPAGNPTSFWTTGETPLTASSPGWFFDFDSDPALDADLDPDLDDLDPDFDCFDHLDPDLDCS